MNESETREERAEFDLEDIRQGELFCMICGAPSWGILAGVSLCRKHFETRKGRQEWPGNRNPE